MIGTLMTCGPLGFQLHLMGKMSGGHTSVVEYAVSLKGSGVTARGCKIRPGMSEVINLF